MHFANTFGSQCFQRQYNYHHFHLTSRNFHSSFILIIFN